MNSLHFEDNKAQKQPIPFHINPLLMGGLFAQNLYSRSFKFVYHPVYINNINSDFINSIFLSFTIIITVTLNFL